MLKKIDASHDTWAFADRARQRRTFALSASIRPCIEPLEGRTLLSSLPAQGDAVAEPVIPAVMAAESSSDVRAVICGQGSIVQEVPYVLNLSATGSGVNAIGSWRVDWGDGKVETLEGNPSSASHFYAAAGSYTISAWATAVDGEHEAVSAQLGAPVRVGTFTELSTVFEYNGLKYFTADHDGTATLWRTDGTADGTYPVKSLGQASGTDRFGHYPETKFCSAGGRMLVQRLTTLWTSDGTEAGTQVLDELRSEDTAVIACGNRALYKRGDGYMMTDGVTVTPLGSLSCSPGLNPDSAAMDGNTLYFSQYCGNGKEELWRSDGTPQGTELVKGDLPYGVLGDVATVDGKTYFIYKPYENWDTAFSSQLWVTDGTAEGTTLLWSDPNEYNTLRLLSINHALLFTSADEDFEYDVGTLWKADTTTGQVVVLKEKVGHVSAIVNGVLYFRYYDATLWETDGTQAGTKPIGALDSAHFPLAMCMTGVADRVYFNSYSSDSYDFHTLWTSDGTDAGTFSIPGMPLPPVEDIQAVNGAVAIRTRNAIYVYRDWEGDALTRLASPAITIDYNSRMSTAGNMLVFTGTSSTGSELWCCGGEERQRIRVLSAVGTSGLEQTTHEGAAYTLLLSYNAMDPSSIRSWRINWGDGKVETIKGHPSSVTHTYADDGTYTIKATAAAGSVTYAAADTIAGIHNVPPTLSLSGHNKAGFGMPYLLQLGASDPGDDHIRSWTINWGDGSVEKIKGNPSLAKHTYAAKGSYTITASATDEDGTSSRVQYGAEKVDEMPDEKVASVREVTSPRGMHYYLKVDEDAPLDSEDCQQAWELWRDDAASGSAVLLHTFYADGPGSDNDPVSAMLPPGDFTFVGETLFFTADDDVSGRELWATDNTANRAWAVKDLRPGTHKDDLGGYDPEYPFPSDDEREHPNGSNPHDLVSFNSKLYFLALEGLGVTLWQSDGQEVSKADDILDKIGGRPDHIFLLDGTLIVAPEVGRYTYGQYPVFELWQVDSSGVVSPFSATHPTWSWSGDVYEMPLIARVEHVNGRVYFVSGEYSGQSSPYTGYPAYNYQSWAVSGGPIHLRVGNPKPALVLSGESVVDEGSVYALGLDYFDLEPASVRSVTIDWGDGKSETVRGGVSSVKHTYGDGPYTAKISVSWKDKAGTHTLASGPRVSVRNVAPKQSLKGDWMVEAGQEYTLKLGSSDPGQDTIKSWQIEWGDGHIEKIAGHPSRAAHQYDKAGIYGIRASVTDEDGTFGMEEPTGVKVSEGRGAISGCVFNDLDGEGRWDGGDHKLSGWCVYLDSNSNGRFDRKEAWTLTDARGRYTFKNLLSGTYRVGVKLPRGWRQSSWPMYAVNVEVKANEIVTQTFAVTQKVLADMAVFHTDASKTI